VLVLRSAPMGQMRAFLEHVVVHCSSPTLHVMSHARDEATIRAMAPCDITFHAYPTPGRYRVEDVPAAMLDQLRSIDFGTLFYLDTDISADLFAKIEKLFAAILENRMVGYRSNGTYVTSTNWRQRRRAEAAFLRLIAWYQLRVDPRFPHGPAPTAEATAESVG
jgi:hypothetical protein